MCLSVTSYWLTIMQYISVQDLSFPGLTKPHPTLYLLQYVKRLIMFDNDIDMYDSYIVALW